MSYVIHHTSCHIIPYVISCHINRIVCCTIQGLLSIYAYVMAPGGILYHSTDVKELHEWMEARGCSETQV